MYGEGRSITAAVPIPPGTAVCLSGIPGEDMALGGTHFQHGSSELRQILFTDRIDVIYENKESELK